MVNSSVDFIAFTGSRETGKKIMEQSAKSLKPLIMELGGKDPLIVLKDADLHYAARFAVANSFENTGQMCISTERVLVDASIAEPFQEKVVEFARKYQVGPWTDSDANLSPMVNANQAGKVRAQIDDALAKGATLLLGKGEEERQNEVVSPTVLTGVTKQMDVDREETFGPVVAIQAFQNVDQAIDLANDSPFGLGAVIYGSQEVDYVAERLEVGMIGVNCSVEAAGDTPWIGAKESSFGYHGSPDGHRQFTRPCVITRRK